MVNFRHVNERLVELEAMLGYAEQVATVRPDLVTLVEYLRQELIVCRELVSQLERLAGDLHTEKSQLLYWMTVLEESIAASQLCSGVLEVSVKAQHAAVVVG